MSTSMEALAIWSEYMVNVDTLSLEVSLIDRRLLKEETWNYVKYLIYLYYKFQWGELSVRTQNCQILVEYRCAFKF